MKAGGRGEEERRERVGNSIEGLVLRGLSSASAGVQPCEVAFRRGANLHVPALHQRLIRHNSSITKRFRLTQLVVFLVIHDHITIPTQSISRALCCRKAWAEGPLGQFPGSLHSLHPAIRDPNFNAPSFDLMNLQYEGSHDCPVPDRAVACQLFQRQHDFVCNLHAPHAIPFRRCFLSVTMLGHLVAVTR